MHRRKVYSANICLFIKLPFFVFCLIGLILHAYFYTKEYLRYATLSDVNLHESDYIEVPTVSICFAASSIMNGKGNISSFIELQEIIETKNLEEIFSSTPSTNNLIVFCTIRRNDTYGVIRREKDCLQYFKTNKIFRLGFICYRFTLDETSYVSKKMFLRPVLQAQSSPGVLFEVGINETVGQKVDYFNVFISEKHVPLAQETYLAHFSRQPMSFGLFYISYNVKISNLLPAPYDTNCHDYRESYGLQSQCYQRCMMDQLKRDNRSLSMELLTDEDEVGFQQMGKVKYASMSLQRDTNFTKYFDEIEGECKWLCRRPDCHSSFHITQGITSTRENRFSVILYSPSEHLLEASRRPEIETTQYLNDVVSFFSIWFGLSVLGLTQVITMFIQAFHQTPTPNLHHHERRDRKRRRRT